MRKRINWNALIIIVLGGTLLYFNSTIEICTGLLMLNPFCWAGSLMTHSIMLIIGALLLIIGLVKLANN